MFQTLSKLAVRNEFCQEISDLGGLNLMIEALDTSIGDKVPSLQPACCLETDNHLSTFTVYVDRAVHIKLWQLNVPKVM